LSVASLSDSLGLPCAPGIFAGSDWGFPDELELTFLRLPQPDDGPPPDPQALYCPTGAELYNYQSDGVQFLMNHPIALLGDEMGLGKSIQAIASLRLLVHQGAVTRVLILCPKSLVFDWYYKLKQWAPDLRVLPIEGPKRRRQWYWRSKTHVNLIGYETWARDVKEGLVNPDDFDLVILDEVQRIKNPSTATHQAVTQLKAPYRWGLSGTPLENSVAELIAIFAYLVPGLLPAVRKGVQTSVVRERIAPYVLRRRKVDVLQHLPPKQHQTVWLDLTPVQRMAYEAAERAGVFNLKQAATGDTSMLALVLLTKLKQICNLDQPTGGSAKMDYLAKELPRLQAQGEKALIFSQYPEKTLKPLLPRLAPFRVALFDGSLSDWNRQLLIHRFQHADDPGLLAMSLKCGGVGITLTRANHVFHFDHWWNPAAALQAEDRAHRIGQKLPVYVTTLLTRGTVEERIAELLEQKRELFHQVMDPLTDTESAAEPAALARLISRDDLMRLFGVGGA
jgi:SNF2 family DNA or RNA helicase